MAVAQGSTEVPDAEHAEFVGAAPADAGPGGRSPWYEQVAEWGGLAVVGACIVFLASQLQLHLVLTNTTIAGGDTGAHVWFPAFLRDHLLPWHLAGWTGDSYAGFPAGQ